MDWIGYELFTVLKSNEPEVVHWILYNGSPHVGVVLSGNGTVVLPQGGHGVTEITCVAHDRRSSDAVRRKRVVVFMVIYFVCVEIMKVDIGIVSLYTFNIFMTNMTCFFCSYCNYSLVYNVKTNYLFMGGLRKCLFEKSHRILLF
jgi:hypothetical protein